MSPTGPAASDFPVHSAGHVTFLGAGPGDPGLLTLRAVEALASADVLVAEPDVLGVVRCHARAGVSTPELAVVDAQSTAAGVPVLRDAANLVMEAAKGGRRVVRAVAGDPGLDGNAAAEMLACASAGIPFEVGPGVANAVGVPAYAGVPLRDAQGADVRFIDARTATDRCWSEVGVSDA
ncbi:uroporphyrinogen-III C-methyltransferase, partial [Streptomyces sp. DT225]